MVDAENRGFVKRAKQDGVQGACRGEIGAERLLDNDARAFVAIRFPQLLHYQPEQHGRNREIVRRMLAGANLPPDRAEGSGVFVVAVDIAQQAAQLLEGRAIDAAVLLEAVIRTRPELVETPAGFGDAD